MKPTLLARITSNPVWWGGALGFAAGLVATLWPVWQAYLSNRPESVYVGAPQGVDEWVYMALVRAVWRSPTQFTYSYPYDLWWKTPPVLIQLPIALAAWLGRVVGIPGAFEILRVLGAAGSGAALGAIGARLFRRGVWRNWFWVAAIAGGGWFAWLTAYRALQLSGPDGLTIPWIFQIYSYGPLYQWRMFLLENLTYPLECVYHGLVLGTFAALLYRREKTALLLAFAAWFSNPFPAISICSAVLPWRAWNAVAAQPCERRTEIAWFAAWCGVCVLGYGYYGPFLSQWPLLKDLARIHRVPLAPPYSAVQTLALIGPWVAGLAWSIVSPAGWRHIWKKREWRLFAIMALALTALVQQGVLLGEKAVQPHHFNRGYLQLAYVAVFFRAVEIWSWRPARGNGQRHDGTRGLQQWRRQRFPRWAVVAVSLTLFDQVLFCMDQILGKVPSGFVSKSYYDIARELDNLSPGSVVYCEPEFLSPYVAAYTNVVPFNAPEVMSVPMVAERQHVLGESLAGRGKPAAELGLRGGVVTRNGETEAALKRQRWREQASFGEIVVMTPE